MAASTTVFGMSAPKEPESAKKKVKILLVDDTPDNLVSLEAALDTLGEDLVMANSGREALRYLLEDDFAAILLDVKMPDMDGFETAELVRSHPRSRHTPILFLTGYKNEEHLFRGYDLGAVDFLFKPIVPEILRSKVVVFVELSRKANLLRQQAVELEAQALAVEKAGQKFRSLLEAAPDAMLICRETGVITLVNSRTEFLFGYPRQHLLGSDIRMLVPDWSFEILPAPDEDVTRALVQPRGAGHELRAIRKDGSTFPVEISLSPLETEEGLLITSALRDITERRKAEEERRKAEEQIRELNAHLEQRVLERTEELLRSNDELAQFAYIASHDLQEPLRTVSIYTELLSEKYGHLLEGDAQEFMGYVITNAHRMEQLIRDLLDFSRLDARGSDYFANADCEAALDDALTNLHLRIDESSAIVERSPLPSVVGDSIQLTRLFQNLIMNSIRYRSGERPCIRISAENRGQEWLFSVQDNGIGIEPQYADKVFGIFKRLHSHGAAGTGIGLAICKKIVARHGGRIWVDSKLGAGATFYFTLPALPK